MIITDAILASFAAGIATQEERVGVVQSLAKNPQEMELVMMMMDEDYEITLDEEQASFESEGAECGGSDDDTSSLLAYSAAAFAPQSKVAQHIIDVPGHADKGSFAQRLDDLLTEVEDKTQE